MPIPENSVGNMHMLAFPMEMQGEGVTGALMKMEGLYAGGNSVIIYFSSDDCAIEESKVEQAGGKIFKSTQSIGEYGAMVLAFDTDGNMK